MSGRTPSPQGAEAAIDWAGVVERVSAGDRAAFLQLARLVTGHLVHWRAFDFRDDWDDLVQEVIVAVVEARRAGRIENSAALPGYLRQTARFKLIDRLRRRQRVASDVDPERAAAEAWPADGGELSSEERLAIWRAVDRLGEKERIAVVEVYARGKTYEQAAADSAIPLGSLKRYLRDGLAALRLALEEGS